MPKVKAGIADVSTEYVQIEPAVYEFKIDKIETRKDPNDPDYLITSKVDEPGTDHHNKPVREYIAMNKKDGTPNEYGMAELKRYFEAVLGEEETQELAENDELDTDMLLNGRFQAEVYLESFDRKDKETGKPILDPEGNPVQGTNARLKGISPL